MSTRTWTAEELVSALGVSYRWLDYWTRVLALEERGGVLPRGPGGSGRARRWTRYAVSELRDVRDLCRLRDRVVQRLELRKEGRGASAPE